MNSYPRIAEIKGKKFEINTDFRVALKCNEIITSADVSDEEKSLAVIYLLFGDEGLNDCENWNGLIRVATKYLSCGKDTETENEYDDEEKEANMDYQQDWGYIRTSFFSDYAIDLDIAQMHWWRFYELLCGLSEKCIFNRVRFIRDFDISQIKDSEEQAKWIKQKEIVALKQEKNSEEKRLDELFEKQIRRWITWQKQMDI